jgi:DNA repair exonuclease SbcCD ATPase subunit
MILFKTIKWKNFLSTGQHETELDFTKNRTNLIIGTNGAGKSTVLDALTFSLFGKPFRKINKPQLINTVNEKDCRVEVEFSIGTTDWKVVRGIKPSLFEIYRNGNILDQSAAALDQQKWLEQNVLKMNYKSFTQIVILGSSTFVPFMQLSAAHRREVIEDLLDIKIFSSMNTIIKEKIRTAKEDIKILELKKESLLDKVKMQKDFIEELENRGNANINANKRKIVDLDVEIEQYIGENSSLEEPLREFIREQDQIIGFAEKLKKLGNLKGKISQKVSTITQEHKFFTENTVCPTCTQSIEETFRINRITDAQNKAKE